MRVDGWEEILHDEIESAAFRPFAWGTNDCATWAAGVRAALRGEEKQRWGSYKTERGAMLWLKRNGYDDLEAWGRDILGEPLPTPLMAQRGDVVLNEAFGICTGHMAVFVAPNGLHEKQLRDCALAWRT